MPNGNIGDWCRVENQPENKTLVYPNGQYFEFSDIYTQFCPCNEDMVCHQSKCALHSNHINSVYNLFGDFF